MKYKHLILAALEGKTIESSYNNQPWWAWPDVSHILRYFGSYPDGLPHTAYRIKPDEPKQRVEYYGIPLQSARATEEEIKKVWGNGATIIKMTTGFDTQGNSVKTVELA